MALFHCKIINKKNIKGHDYYLVSSIDERKTYHIPFAQLDKYNVQINKVYIFSKKQNTKSKKIYLEYFGEQFPAKVNVEYNVGDIYDFKVNRFDKSINKKGEEVPVIFVEYASGKSTSIRSIKWQTPDNWKFETVSCEVEKIELDGSLRLLNRDYRHHLYEVGKNYEFEVLGEKQKETSIGVVNIINLKGNDGCYHEVSKLPNQRIDLLNGKIWCKVKKITTSIHLSQVNIRDYYYSKFSDIVESNTLKRKHFQSIFDDVNGKSKDEEQLMNQYNSESAFWVFTYANKILPKNLRDNIERQNYKIAKEINELIIAFEEWILNKGIITSFPDEEIRDQTKSKAKSQLKSAQLLNSVLGELIKNQFEILKDDEFFRNTEDAFSKFYYIITLSNINLVNVNDFVERLLSILATININENRNPYRLKLLLKHIAYQKKHFISEKDEEFFSLSTNRSDSLNFTESEKKFLLWSYGELLISKTLKLQAHYNVLCGQLLKLFTKSISDVRTKELLLFNAYHLFENYQQQLFFNPFVLSDKLELNVRELYENPIYFGGQESWEELENNFVKKEYFEVRLTRKSKNGFEVNFKGIKGFLPLHHIENKSLKYYPFTECDLTVWVKCLTISKAFNFFITEQKNNFGEINLYENAKNIKVGEMYDGIIKGIVDYGLFIATNIGEGLLHVDDIFLFNWNRENLNKYFKTKQRIRVILTKNQEGKLAFNFKDVEKLDPIYFEEYIEKLFQNDASLISNNFDSESDSYFDTAQNEKAFCIEQYAVLQTDLLEKLQNFRIAKQFYTNAKNARSFLINIYTSYFEILLKISKALQKSSLKTIIDIKKDAREIINKINQKTIQVFPDSDKLIFFLDIISLFNEKSDIMLELLFDYIKKYNLDKSHSDLKTIAKITLANNLLMSEVKTDSDFSLKNLRLIYDYLSNGILSLEETIEDKNARELKEEILYLSEKIKEDESETLEFKSSLFTPILDSESKIKLEKIRSAKVQTESIKVEISKLTGELAKKRILHSALKTLVAFANTAGGMLLIGVNDTKNIIGIENEYLTFSKKTDQGRDGYGKFFDDTVRTYLGDGFSSLMERKFVKFPQGDVLVIKIRPSNQEIFLLKNEEGKDEEQLYIRNLSSSKELLGSELVMFIKNKNFDS